jgi:iron complex outermembrane recepter protein
MEQRAAMNVKSVVASDAFGDLSEGNVGELLQYLPGVDIVYDQSDMTGASIGGMAPQYGALMVDGIRVSSTSGTGRGPGFTSINVRVAEMVELNKTVSADMDADAPAGSINLRSKTAFQRKGRQVSWQLYASANSEKLTLKRIGGPSDAKHHQIHPSGNIEILDTFLNGRLGVVASVDWTHVIHERHHLRHTTNTAPTNVNPDPLVFTQISYADGPKSNRNLRGNLRFDYKVNDRLTLALSGQIRRADTRIYDRTFTLVTTRNDIAPGSNENFQIVNGTTNATRLTMGGGFQERDDQSESVSAHLFYEGNRLEVDGAVSFSQVDILHRNGLPDGSGEGPPSAHTISLFPISWRMERSGPADTAWSFQQLAGPDLYNLNNWNFSFPTANVARNGTLNRPTRKKYAGHLNAKFTTAWHLPTFFKGGLKVQEEIYSILTGSHTWTYVGPRDAAAIVSSVVFDPKLGGNLFSDRDLQWPNRNVIGELLESHPDYFQPSAADATNAANTAPRRYVKEQINAAYLMGNTQLGRLILQGGARFEETHTAGRIYERGQLVSRGGKYDNLFWSASAKYRIADNLFAIAGYNQSIARPAFNNLSGVLSVNDDTMIGNIPNPALRPEYGDNYSARLEYYLKSAGILSVSFFRRNIEDLHVQRSQIPAEDLGLEQDYPGYLFTSWTNAGEGFRSDGYEIEYNQQLTKLPGIFKGLGVFANYTRVKSSDVAFAYGSSPKRASGGFTYRYKSFSGSLRGSWSDDTLTSETLYRKARTILGLSLRYQLPRNMAIFVNGRNITKDPITSYLNSQPDLLTAYGQFGSNWTIGVEGRF